MKYMGLEIRSISQAFVLAAGFGSRLKPITSHTPKPLVRINNIPLIDYTIHNLNSYGVAKIVINAHYLAEQISEYVLHKYSNVVVSVEEEILETGGGLLKALPYFNIKEPLFVMSSDVIIQDNRILEKITDYFYEIDADILLLLKDKEKVATGKLKGDFVLNDDGTIEKSSNEGRNKYVFTGVQILHPRIFTLPLPGRFFPLNYFYFNQNIKDKIRLRGVKFDGDFFHIGTEQELCVAEKKLNQLIPF